MCLTSWVVLPVVADGAEPEESAATDAFLHAPGGNTMAEGRCTPDRFGL